MGDYAAYPAYKNSGIEWLGEIPVHWSAPRLRFALETNPSNSDVPLEDNELVSFVPMEAVGEYGGLDLGIERPVGDIGSGYTYFANGDVVVAKITPCFENGKGALASGLRNGVGYGTTELHVLRSGESLDTSFLFYLTISHAFRKLGEAEMYGAGGQKRVPERFISNLRPAIPPLPEQRAIARFLDHKTAQIDALIAKKQALLAKLAAKRTALISHAVTKGLVSDVEMKDSGIEWLGEIPAHWDAVRLKHISPSQTVGVVVNPSKYVEDDGEVPFFLGSDIAEGKLLTARVRRISHESNKLLSKSILRPGDLVTVRVGAPGVTAVVPPDLDGSNCASVMIVRGSPTFDSGWLCYAMNSSVGRFNVELVQYGAAQKQFNIGHAVDFWFPVPPKHEQIEIAHYLDSVAADSRSAEGKIQQAIDKLKDYRTALITHAVTGKIDVRAVPIPALGSDA